MATNYRQVGGRLGAYIQANHPTTQQIQALLADLLAGDELLPTIYETVRLPLFRPLREFIGRGDGVVQRDALINELERRYRQSVVEDVRNLLDGMLGLPTQTAREVISTTQAIDRSRNNASPSSSCILVTSSKDRAALFNADNRPGRPYRNVACLAIIFSLTLVTINLYGDPSYLSSNGAENGTILSKCSWWINKSTKDYMVCGETAYKSKKFVDAEKYYTFAVNRLAGYERTEALWYRSASRMAQGKNALACQDLSEILRRQETMRPRSIGSMASSYDSLTKAAGAKLWACIDRSSWSSVPPTQ